MVAKHPLTPKCNALNDHNCGVINYMELLESNNLLINQTGTKTKSRTWYYVRHQKFFNCLSSFSTSELNIEDWGDTWWQYN